MFFLWKAETLLRLLIQIKTNQCDGAAKLYNIIYGHISPHRR